MGYIKDEIFTDLKAKVESLEKQLRELIPHKITSGSISFDEAMRYPDGKQYDNRIHKVIPIEYEKSFSEKPKVFLALSKLINDHTKLKLTAINAEAENITDKGFDLHIYWHTDNDFHFRVEWMAYGE